MIPELVSQEGCAEQGPHSSTAGASADVNSVAQLRCSGKAQKRRKAKAYGDLKW